MAVSRVLTACCALQSLPQPVCRGVARSSSLVRCVVASSFSPVACSSRIVRPAARIAQCGVLCVTAMVRSAWCPLRGSALCAWLGAPVQRPQRVSGGAAPRCPPRAGVRHAAGWRFAAYAHLGASVRFASDASSVLPADGTACCASSSSSALALSSSEVCGAGTLPVSGGASCPYSSRWSRATPASMRARRCGVCAASSEAAGPHAARSASSSVPAADDAAVRPTSPALAEAGGRPGLRSDATAG